jgi:4-amino-4-deoxy-L-arabinose transferase-like glycosyltransferase
MKQKWLLFIVALGFLLRVISLGSYPHGFTPDEASFGYDAYSLIKTGADQWGNSFPLVLKSFGDYKAPFYSYLLIPFVFVFGLNKFAVRLPNVLFGTAAIFITYLLSREVGRRMNFSKEKRQMFALISSFLLSVSPWHIMMSRGAFEANLTTFLLPLGIYLFLKGIVGKDYRKIFFSATVFGLNLFTYHSAKLVTPLVTFSLVAIFFKELKNMDYKKLLPSSVVFSFLFLITIYTFSQGAGVRATQISIFNAAGEDAAQKRLTAMEAGLPAPLARILHNKYQIIIQRFLDNYVQYPSLKFLFASGPSETTYGMIPGRGVLYWFELVFIIGLLYFLFNSKTKSNLKSLAVILLWLILAPTPASSTLGFGYSANRAVIALPALQIILGLGAVEVYGFLKQRLSMRVLKKAMYGFCIVVILFFTSFLEDYFVQSPVISQEGMSYGNLEVAKWLTENISSNQKIIMSTTISEPHIYVTFTNKWNPHDYQSYTDAWSLEESNVAWVDQLPSYTLGNYTFKRIDWNVMQDSDALLVGRPTDFPEGVIPLEVIYYPDGTPSVFVVNPRFQSYARKTD